MQKQNDLPVSRPQTSDPEIVFVLFLLPVFHFPVDSIGKLQEVSPPRIVPIKGHCAHVCLIQGCLLIFISIEADNGQPLLALKLNYPGKMRFQIAHHYQGLRSHYLHGDVMH